MPGCYRAFQLSPTIPYVRLVTLTFTAMTGLSSLPLPFCHAVYQDRLRKDVKKIIAVATVPFLSLISLQRCLSSAECRGPRSCRCLPPSSRCLWGRSDGCRCRHTGASDGLKNALANKPRTRTSSSGGGLGRMDPQLRFVFPCRCSEGCIVLLLYRPTAIGHESTAFRDRTAYMVG